MIMNNKILIEVNVPFLEETYQIFIPINKRISVIIALIEKTLKELTNGYYPTKEGTVIIDEKTGNIYDINITVKESKMMNGSKVILI